MQHERADVEGSATIDLQVDARDHDGPLKVTTEEKDTSIENQKAFIKG
jgi:hypothetical protein